MHAAVARDYSEAVAHLKAGRLDESEAAHRRVLASQPRHAPSLHHLGLIAFKREDRGAAAGLIRQSLEADPGYHQAWLNLAVILGEERRLEEAIDACRRCLALTPESSEPHSVLGNLLRVAERQSEAVTAYQAALRLKPDQPAVLTKLGELALEAGELCDAREYCDRAMALDPELPEARALERRLLAATGSLDQVSAAIAAQSKSAAEQVQGLNDLGNHLRKELRWEDALTAYDRALAIDPESADTHFNRALALEGLGRKEEALQSYQAGLALEPERAEAYANVGNLLRSMDMPAGAIQALEHAIALEPELGIAHYNLAVTLKQRERYEEARAAFYKCVAYAPDSIVNLFELVNLRRILCDWEGIEAEERQCLEAFRTKGGGIAPFVLISMAATRADQLEAARRFVRTIDVAKAARFSSHNGRLGTDRRIRIGFLSCDYFEHATSMLLVEVLEKLDRRRFETYGYCFSPDDGSSLRHRMIAAFEHYAPITALSNRDAAHLIHDDGIDILVDLKGYTKDARPEILAYRPAPIQVNYLGYPGTMGADFIDYLIADRIVAPLEHQEDYSERIVHLPHSYQPNDRRRKISEEPITRADFGLPEDAFVFCSFNNSYKLNATMFDVWMRLLRSVEKSVLWLLVPSDICRDNLRREAAARGVDPDRLVFAGRLSIGKHLARHRLADLFLDALPCNAHTTTSDALWAGLPVLTCTGETFAGRVAASLIAAMGVPELITTSLEEYAQAALTLALDREKLDGVRRKIADGRATAPLFDTERYTRNLEQSFLTMVDIMKAGEAPRPFSVVETLPKLSDLADLEAPLSSARTPYEACPLCEGRDIPHQIEAKVTSHPLYSPELPPTMKWRSCVSCGHVFTEGYLTGDARAIMQATQAGVQKIGVEAENQRRISARIVERIARHVAGGEWLDARAGDGSLVFTAAEWGYQVLAADPYPDSVSKLRDLGFEAIAGSFEDIDATERFSVISMIDVLEQAPFPARSLAAARKMLRKGGALFVTMANTDSIVWRALDATGGNPYWGDLERCHNFSRGRLVGLLEAQGFKFAEYNIAERSRASMEIIAIRA